MNGKTQRGRRFGPPSRAALPVLLLSFLTTAGCSARDLSVPSESQVEEAYVYPSGLSVEMDGNVAEITVVQPEQQLKRGGSLWAKVGPYVLLFSEETQDLFQTYPGLAGIRAVTVTPDGLEVARALLHRSGLNDLTWRRALHIAGLARRDGTERPSLLQELVRWGEDHTEFSYAPRFSHP